MKHIAIVSFVAATALAQNISDVPECGRLCLGNMIALSSSLGCPFVDGLADPACLCSKPDFNYGIRDCTAESCAPQDLAPVINFTAAMCAANGLPAAIVPLKPGPVVPTSVPPVVDSVVPEKTVTPDTVATFTSGSLTMTTTLPATLVFGTSGAIAKTQEDAESTLSRAATSLRGAAASDVRSTLSTSIAAPKSTSEAVAAPLVTVGADTLFAGAVGVVAMLAM
ncbi:hypothetical protein B0T14DRAFT_4208 [Immersiella caudata]|uniref:CFEM domain-containing protein n=1 Tax=Immersiella caudata TaxID=314043 RepID=A0AA40CAX0_9PEZI|nr:hypothetical protein B0T14DRAFT_4208 [Immersiella caudata]